MRGRRVFIAMPFRVLLPTPLPWRVAAKALRRSDGDSMKSEDAGRLSELHELCETGSQVLHLPIGTLALDEQRHPHVGSAGAAKRTQRDAPDDRVRGNRLGLLPGRRRGSCDPTSRAGAGGAHRGRCAGRAHRRVLCDLRRAAPMEGSMTDRLALDLKPRPTSATPSASCVSPSMRHARTRRGHAGSSTAERRVQSRGMRGDAARRHRAPS